MPGGAARDSIEVIAGVAEQQLPAVRAILAEYADLPHNVGRQTGTEEELAGLPNPWVPPAGDILTAWADGAVVGCVVLAKLGPESCEMKRLYVREAARGRGLGRRLVQAVIERGRELGYRQMLLDTAPELAAARALYGRLGFREIEPYHARYADPICFEYDLV